MVRSEIDIKDQARNTENEYMELLNRTFPYTYVIGLTGGVGSGKSTVSKICEERFDMRIITTDDVAREQMEKGGISYDAVVKEFGPGILAADGSIDRGKLAGIVFEQPGKRLLLNELTHPNVINYLIAEITKERERRKTEFILIETALLFEAGIDAICDAVWYVYASEQDRTERLMNSRGYTREKCRSIMDSQKKEEEFKLLCDHTIANGNGTERAETEAQIAAGIEKLKSI